MNCRELKRRLDQGDGSLGAEAREHLESCEACRELAEDDGRLARGLSELEGAVSSDSGRLEFSAVRGELDEDRGLLGRFRETSRLVRTATILAVAFGVAAVLFVWFTRPDLGAYPTVRFWLLAAGFPALMAGVAWAGLRPIYRPSHRWGTVGAATAVLLGYGVLVGGLPPAHTAEPFYHLGVGDHMLFIAARCFLYGSVYALPVAAVGWASMRSSRPLLDRLVLLAVATGTAGHFGLHLNCPLVRPPHLLLGHATVPVAYGLVAVAAVYLFDRG